MVFWVFEELYVLFIGFVVEEIVCVVCVGVVDDDDFGVDWDLLYGFDYCLDCFYFVEDGNYD